MESQQLRDGWTNHQLEKFQRPKASNKANKHWESLDMIDTTVQQNIESDLVAGWWVIDSYVGDI